MDPMDAQDAADSPASATATDLQSDTPSDTPSQASTANGRNLAMLAHLSLLSALVVGFFSVLGPILVWMVPQPKDPFVVAHAKEALNFQITVLGVAAILSVLYAVLGLLSFGLGFLVLLPVYILALAALGIAAGILSILAGMAANRGEAYRYPACIRLVA